MSDTPLTQKDLFEAWLDSPGPAISPDNPYTDTHRRHLYEAWCAAWSAAQQPSPADPLTIPDLLRKAEEPDAHQ